MPRATTSAVWQAPICNLNIVRKSSTALLGVPLHTTRLSPITRISTIGIRHRQETSVVQKALETGKIDNYLGLDAKFFNREKESRSLSHRLANEDPKLTIILGPPSSGKTALVRKVVNSTSNLRPVFIDLRDGTFDTVANTVESLRSQFNTYFDDLSKILASVKAKLPVPKILYEGVEIKLNPASPPKEQFAALLKEIDTRLPTWAVLKGHNVPRPVLVVDEANRFMNLVHTEEGKATIDTFLQWLMINTKQSLRFHVVLTSSGAYFQSWLATRLTHFHTMVVGDLTKSEAERFFHNVLARTQFESIKQELSDKFDQVFDMTGGRMLYIIDYLDEYQEAKMNGEDFKDDEKYSAFLQAYDLLETALDPTQLSELHPQRAPALFSREQFIELMWLFAESSGGFILKQDATSKFGAKTIASFVEYNIVHPRPSGDKNDDVPGSPKRRHILLPMGRPQLRAMQGLLKDLEKTNRK